MPPSNQNGTAIHNVRTIVSNYTQYALDKFVALLCDYGKSIPRTLISMVVVYAVFTFNYWISWGVMRDNVPTRDLYDVILFSLGAMTTMTPTGLAAVQGLLIYWLAWKPC